MQKFIMLFGCLLLLALFGPSVNAQDAKADTVKVIAIYQNIGYEGKFAIGLKAGLPGYGGELAYNFHDHWNVRLGGMFLQISGIEIPYDIDGREINIGLESNGAVYDIKLEYLPSKTKAFKLVAGLAYVNNYGGKASIKLTEGVFIGDLEVGPEDVGQIDINVIYEGVAPYIGFGFGRAVPKRRVGFGMEFGTYYVGAPVVEMDATELLSPSANAEQEANFEKGLDSFRWLPNINAKLTVKLN
jgi:hypothetical protein